MWPQTADYSMTSPSSSYNSSANSSAFFGQGLNGESMNEFQQQLAMTALGGGFPLMPNYQTAVAMADSTTQYAHKGPLRPTKKKPQPVPDSQKDKQYHDRRKKNNISAQKSREARRIRERQHAERVEQLTRENETLQQLNAHLHYELQRRQAQIFALQHQHQQQNSPSDAENATTVAAPRMPFAMGSYLG